jgi:hypothetical protein
MAQGSAGAADRGIMTETNKFSLYLTPAAIVTSGLAAVMLAITLMTGTSQEDFETIWPREIYAADLVRQAGALRLILAVDFCFIAAFTIFFIAWAERQLEQGASGIAVRIGLGAILIVAALDILEDCHLLALLRQALMGLPLSQADLGWQMVESQVKFALSTIGIAILGLTWPKQSALARLIKVLLLVQVVLGAAVAVTLAPLQTWLGLLRALFLVTGPVLLVWAEGRDESV